MPRNGSGIYTRPPGTDGVPDTTIESAKYNTWVGDVETDLNAPRPIIAGGTGATSAEMARENLQAEVASQVVTNYDTHVWEMGSFFSLAAATNPPVATHAFAGVVYGSIDEGVPANNKTVIEARDLHDPAVPGLVYVRERLGTGAWSAWTVDGSNAFVDAAGDTMTGNLTITKDGPQLVLNKTADPGATVRGQKNGLDRWVLNLANGIAEGAVGSNLGSNFSLTPYSDLGVALTPSISIARASGIVTIGGDISLSKAAPTLRLEKLASGQSSSIIGTVNGVARWNIELGSSDAEGGVADGSSFVLHKYNNDGSYGGQAFHVNRATGAVTFAAPCNLVGGGHWSYAGAGAGSWYDTNALADRFFCGTASGADQFRIYTSAVSNALTIEGATGNATFIGSVSAGAYLTAATAVVSYGGLVVVQGTNLPALSLRNAAGTEQAAVLHDVTLGNTHLRNALAATDITIHNDGSVVCGKGFVSHAGAGGAYTSSIHNFNWTGNLEAWVDVTNLGNIAFTSDYRVKKDVADLASTWDAVKALRPVRYTQAEYTPVDAQAPLFAADSIERWGFIAHEVQTALLPSAAEGVKDQPDRVQSLNLPSIIASLAKALQEAMARIEALEAKVT